jgi:hypothetical protein
MRSLATALTILGALAAGAASSQQADEAQAPAITAQDLQQLCEGTDHVSRNACRIYILGVTQGLALGMRIADGKTASARPCVPAAISAEKLEETLKTRLGRDLAANPAKRDQDAAGFIGTVLGEAYPCQKAGR